MPGGTSSRSVCRALRRGLSRGAKVRTIRFHLNKLEAWKRSRAIISFGSTVGAQGHNFCRRSRSRREPSLGPRSRPRRGLGGSRKLSEVCRKGWSQRSRSPSCLGRWRVAQWSRSSFSQYRPRNPREQAPSVGGEFDLGRGRGQAVQLRAPRSKKRSDPSSQSKAKTKGIDIRGQVINDPVPLSGVESRSHLE